MTGRGAAQRGTAKCRHVKARLAGLGRAQHDMLWPGSAQHVAAERGKAGLAQRGMAGLCDVRQCTARLARSPASNAGLPLLKPKE